MGARASLVRSLVCVGGVGLLGGCLLGDPPPAPENAPIEVVATSSVKPDQDCLLNRPEVGAGPHGVYLISEQGPADVRIVGPTGDVVFEGHAVPQDAAEAPEEGGEMSATPVVRLTAGVHRVECRPVDGRPSAAELRVVPARPGFEDIAPDG